MVFVIVVQKRSVQSDYKSYRYRPFVLNARSQWNKYRYQPPVYCPWHFLNFFPLPQWHGSFRPSFFSSRRTVMDWDSSELAPLCSITFCDCFWKMVCEFTRLQLEFGAETLQKCSTHEYCKFREYELQTPTLSGWTGIQFFRVQTVKVQYKKNVLIL